MSGVGVKSSENSPTALARIGSSSPRQEGLSAARGGGGEGEGEEERGERKANKAVELLVEEEEVGGWA